MTRRNIVLATLLVIQLGIVLFVFWPRGTNASASPLVPELTLDKITGLTVQDATVQVQLAKVDDQWVLPAADNYPVLAPNVTRLIPMRWPSTPVAWSQTRRQAMGDSRYPPTTLCAGWS